MTEQKQTLIGKGLVTGAEQAQTGVNLWKKTIGNRSDDTTKWALYPVESKDAANPTLRFLRPVQWSTQQPSYTLDLKSDRGAMVVNASGQLVWVRETDTVMDQSGNEYILLDNTFHRLIVVSTTDLVFDISPVGIRPADLFDSIIDAYQLPLTPYERTDAQLWQRTVSRNRLPVITDFSSPATSGEWITGINATHVFDTKGVQHDREDKSFAPNHRLAAPALPATITPILANASAPSSRFFRYLQSNARAQAAWQRFATVVQSERMITPKTPKKVVVTICYVNVPRLLSAVIPQLKTIANTQSVYAFVSVKDADGKSPASLFVPTFASPSMDQVEFGWLKNMKDGLLRQPHFVNKGAENEAQRLAFVNFLQFSSGAWLQGELFRTANFTAIRQRLRDKNVDFRAARDGDNRIEYRRQLTDLARLWFQETREGTALVHIRILMKKFPLPYVLFWTNTKNEDVLNDKEIFQTIIPLVGPVSARFFHPKEVSSIVSPSTIASPKLFRPLLDPPAETQVYPVSADVTSESEALEMVSFMLNRGNWDAPEYALWQAYLPFRFAIPSNVARFGDPTSDARFNLFDREVMDRTTGRDLVMKEWNLATRSHDLTVKLDQSITRDWSTWSNKDRGRFSVSLLLHSPSSAKRDADEFNLDDYVAPAAATAPLLADDDVEMKSEKASTFSSELSHALLAALAGQHVSAHSLIFALAGALADEKNPVTIFVFDSDENELLEYRTHPDSIRSVDSELNPIPLHLLADPTEPVAAESKEAKVRSDPLRSWAVSDLLGQLRMRIDVQGTDLKPIATVELKAGELASADFGSDPDAVRIIAAQRQEAAVSFDQLPWSQRTDFFSTIVIEHGRLLLEEIDESKLSGPQLSQLIAENLSIARPMLASGMTIERLNVLVAENPRAATEMSPKLSPGLTAASPNVIREFIAKLSPSAIGSSLAQLFAANPSTRAKFIEKVLAANEEMAPELSRRLSLVNYAAVSREQFNQLVNRKPDFSTRTGLFLVPDELINQTIISREGDSDKEREVFFPEKPGVTHTYLAMAVQVPNAVEDKVFPWGNQDEKGAVHRESYSNWKEKPESAKDAQHNMRSWHQQPNRRVPVTFQMPGDTHINLSDLEADFVAGRLNGNDVLTDVLDPLLSDVTQGASFSNPIDAEVAPVFVFFRAILFADPRLAGASAKANVQLSDGERPYFVGHFLKRVGPDALVHVHHTGTDGFLWPGFKRSGSGKDMKEVKDLWIVPYSEIFFWASNHKSVPVKSFFRLPKKESIEETPKKAGTKLRGWKFSNDNVFARAKEAYVARFTLPRPDKWHVACRLCRVEDFASNLILCSDCMSGFHPVCPANVKREFISPEEGEEEESEAMAKIKLALATIGGEETKESPAKKGGKSGRKSKPTKKKVESLTDERTQRDSYHFLPAQNLPSQDVADMATLKAKVRYTCALCSPPPEHYREYSEQKKRITLVLSQDYEKQAEQVAREDLRKKLTTVNYRFFQADSGARLMMLMTAPSDEPRLLSLSLFFQLALNWNSAYLARPEYRKQVMAMIADPAQAFYNNLEDWLLNTDPKNVDSIIDDLFKEVNNGRAQFASLKEVDKASTLFETILNYDAFNKAFEDAKTLEKFEFKRPIVWQSVVAVDVKSPAQAAHAKYLKKVQTLLLSMALPVGNNVAIQNHNASLDQFAENETWNLQAFADIFCRSALGSENTVVSEGFSYLPFYKPADPTAVPTEPVITNERTFESFMNLMSVVEPKVAAAGEKYVVVEGMAKSLEAMLAQAVEPRAAIQWQVDIAGTSEIESQRSPDSLYASWVFASGGDHSKEFSFVAPWIIRGDKAIVWVPFFTRPETKWFSQMSFLTDKEVYHAKSTDEFKQLFDARNWPELQKFVKGLTQKKQNDNAWQLAQLYRWVDEEVDYLEQTKQPDKELSALSTLLLNVLGKLTYSGGTHRKDILKENMRWSDNDAIELFGGSIQEGTGKNEKTVVIPGKHLNRLYHPALTDRNGGPVLWTFFDEQVLFKKKARGEVKRVKQPKVKLNAEAKEAKRKARQRGPQEELAEKVDVSEDPEYLRDMESREEVVFDETRKILVQMQTMSTHLNTEARILLQFLLVFIANKSVGTPGTELTTPSDYSEEEYGGPFKSKFEQGLQDYLTVRVGLHMVSHDLIPQAAEYLQYTERGITALEVTDRNINEAVLKILQNDSRKELKTAPLKDCDMKFPLLLPALEAQATLEWFQKLQSLLPEQAITPSQWSALAATLWNAIPEITGRIAAQFVKDATTNPDMVSMNQQHAQRLIGHYAKEDADGDVVSDQMIKKLQTIIVGAFKDGQIHPLVSGDVLSFMDLPVLVDAADEKMMDAADEKMMDAASQVDGKDAKQEVQDMDLSDNGEPELKSESKVESKTEVKSDVDAEMELEDVERQAIFDSMWATMHEAFPSDDDATQDNEEVPATQYSQEPSVKTGDSSATPRSSETSRVKTRAFDRFFMGLLADWERAAASNLRGQRDNWEWRDSTEGRRWRANQRRQLRITRVRARAVMYELRTHLRIRRNRIARASPEFRRHWREIGDALRTLRPGIQFNSTRALAAQNEDVLVRLLMALHLSTIRVENDDSAVIDLSACPATKHLWANDRILAQPIVPELDSRLCALCLKPANRFHRAIDLFVETERLPNKWSPFFAINSIVHAQSPVFHCETQTDHLICAWDLAKLVIKQFANPPEGEKEEEAMWVSCPTCKSVHFANAFVLALRSAWFARLPRDALLAFLAKEEEFAALDPRAVQKLLQAVVDQSGSIQFGVMKRLIETTFDILNASQALPNSQLAAHELVQRGSQQIARPEIEDGVNKRLLQLAGASAGIIGRNNSELPEWKLAIMQRDTAKAVHKKLAVPSSFADRRIWTEDSFKLLNCLEKTRHQLRRGWKHGLRLTSQQLHLHGEVPAIQSLVSQMSWSGLQAVAADMQPTFEKADEEEEEQEDEEETTSIVTGSNSSSWLLDWPGPRRLPSGERVYLLRAADRKQNTYYVQLVGTDTIQIVPGRGIQKDSPSQSLPVRPQHLLAKAQPDRFKQFVSSVGVGDQITFYDYRSGQLQTNWFVTHAFTTDGNECYLIDAVSPDTQQSSAVTVAFVVAWTRTPSSSRDEPKWSKWRGTSIDMGISILSSSD